MELQLLALVYAIFGVYVTALFLGLVKQRNITADYMLLFLPEEERDFIYDHPLAWKIAMWLVLLVIFLAWPYFLYDMFKNLD